MFHTTPLLLFFLCVFAPQVWTDDKTGSASKRKNYFLPITDYEKELEHTLDLCPDTLIKGFESSTEREQEIRLRLLSPMIHDSSCNHLAFNALRENAPSLFLQAIAYLAGHPDPDNNDYLAWQDQLFTHNKRPQIEAYLSGVRKPAPDFQVSLIHKNYGILNKSLRSLALKAIHRGWRNTACPALNHIVMGMREGRFDSKHQLEAMHHLADVATPDALPSLLFSLNASSQNMRNEGQRILQGILGHLHRAHQFQQIPVLYDQLFQAFPTNMEYGLESASALILYANKPEKGLVLLRGLNSKLSNINDMARKTKRMEIALGQALGAYFLNQSWRIHLQDKRIWPPRDTNSNPEKRLIAKRDLLLGALTILQGEDGINLFLSALQIAPYDPGFAEIDHLFSSRFGLSPLIWRLNQNQNEEGAALIFKNLVKALEEDGSGSSYYCDSEEGAFQTDRIKSSIPLNHAFFLMHHYGAPKKALERLDEFIRRTQDSTYFSNVDLVGRAYYFQGLCALDNNNPTRSKDAVEKGIKIYEQNLEDLKTLWKSQAVRDARLYYNNEKARGHLYLQSINNIQGGPVKKSVQLVRKAVKTAPDFDDAVIPLFMEDIRKGGAEAGKRLIDNIQIYPDRYYNMACICALLDQKDQALLWLKRHLLEYTPPRRLGIEKQYAIKDPDLRKLRSEPGFIELTR